DGRLKTSRWLLFLDDHCLAHVYLNQCSYGECVCSRSLELELQISIIGQLSAFVAVDGRLHVHIVDDEVQVSVVVEIGVSTAIGKCGSGKPPGFRHVVESEVAFIPEGIIGKWCCLHFVDDWDYLILVSCKHHGTDNLVGEEIDKVNFGEVADNAVCDKNVFVPVIIHIEYERSPAPIRSGHTAIVGDFGERVVAVVDLQGVLYVLLIEVATLLELEDIVVVEFHYR